ncbi:fused MFS/spermidine synthase [Aequorivita sp. SDUM287046]|uniref:Fused MFS/spermidine synthase n=1 Tax=Aequorivita aurantiaca TaxID=3053356 RepID=A0ABT8DJI6_9FLAO|nr:fused MFS/spermidine synthase [Aequorivita aurantiaca]MDN3724979.1 fused MFS/spermidine synthase [Aequorivita aurantiaca]
MRKLLSYFWPITKRFSSEINGILEVTYNNGKKVLDSTNANYSYGSLQKILEFGISKVDMQQLENVLILGMGGGSVIHSLRKMGFSKHILAVEIDPEIIKLAKSEFNIEEASNLKIVQQDASKYVEGCSDTFQLIIIDIFIDLTVPTKFYEKEFCQNVSKILDNVGVLIFNVGVNLDPNSQVLEMLLSHFGINFKLQAYSKVNGTNTLLIGKKYSH